MDFILRVLPPAKVSVTTWFYVTGYSDDNSNELGQTNKLVTVAYASNNCWSLCTQSSGLYSFGLLKFHDFPWLSLIFPMTFQSFSWPKFDHFLNFPKHILISIWLCFILQEKKLPTRLFILYNQWNFPWQTPIKFHDFLGLDNEIIKFHDFPGFSWPMLQNILKPLKFAIKWPSILHCTSIHFYFLQKWVYKELIDIYM